MYRQETCQLQQIRLCTNGLSCYIHLSQITSCILVRRLTVFFARELKLTARKRSPILPPEAKYVTGLD
jgi:hypothetical protein